MGFALLSFALVSRGKSFAQEKLDEGWNSIADGLTVILVVLKARLVRIEDVVGGDCKGGIISKERKG